jgi:hypothetical protein
MTGKWICRLLSLLLYALKKWYLGTATTLDHFTVFLCFKCANIFFCNVIKLKKIGRVRFNAFRGIGLTVFNITIFNMS